jgi:hypothetical protein
VGLEMRLERNHEQEYGESIGGRAISSKSGVTSPATALKQQIESRKPFTRLAICSPKVLCAGMPVRI